MPSATQGALGFQAREHDFCSPAHHAASASGLPGTTFKTSIRRPTTAANPHYSPLVFRHRCLQLFFPVAGGVAVWQIMDGEAFGWILASEPGGPACAADLLQGLCDRWSSWFFLPCLSCPSLIRSYCSININQSDTGQAGAPCWYIRAAALYPSPKDMRLSSDSHLVHLHEVQTLK